MVAKWRLLRQVGDTEAQAEVLQQRDRADVVTARVAALLSIMAASSAAIPCTNVYGRPFVIPAHRNFMHFA